MPPEVVAAIIALCGVVVSTFISLMVAIWSRKYNYSHLFADTVSKNRMEWINVWRENLATFLACAKLLHNRHNQTQKRNAKSNLMENDDILFKMEKARSMITLRLNLNEDKHKLMLSAIMNLDYNPTNNKFNAQCEYIEELARAILKPEWERVKSEAKGENL